MYAIAKTSLKMIRIEGRHKQLKVLFLAVVGRRGQKQKMACNLAEELTQFVSLGRFDFAAEK